MKRIIFAVLTWKALSIVLLSIIIGFIGMVLYVAFFSGVWRGAGGLAAVGAIQGIFLVLGAIIIRQLYEIFAQGSVVRTRIFVGIVYVVLLYLARWFI